MGAGGWKYICGGLGYMNFFMGGWVWVEVCFWIFFIGRLEWVRVSEGLFWMSVGEWVGDHSFQYKPNTNTSNEPSNNVLKNLRLINLEKDAIDLVNISILKTSLCFSLKWFEINSIC